MAATPSDDVQLPASTEKKPAAPSKFQWTSSTNFHFATRPAAALTSSAPRTQVPPPSDEGAPPRAALLLGTTPSVSGSARFEFSAVSNRTEVSSQPSAHDPSVTPRLFGFGPQRPSFADSSSTLTTPETPVSSTAGFRFVKPAPIVKPTSSVAPPSGRVRPAPSSTSLRVVSAASNFEEVLKKPIVRAVVGTFDALHQRQAELPPPLAPMVLHLVNTFMEAQVVVDSALCIPKLTEPNWWRNVVLDNADIDVAKYAPRLRMVTIKAAAGADLRLLLSSVCRLGKLQHLTTPFMWPSDCVAQFMGMTSLDVSRSSIADADLQRLVVLPALQTLRLECSQLSDVRPIAKCVSLTELDARNLSLLTPEGLETLPLLRLLTFQCDRAAPSLMRLGQFGVARSLRELTANVDLEASGLNGLAASQTLRKVFLPRGVSHKECLVQLQQLPLEDLLLGATRHISVMDVLDNVCGPIPTLTSLNVNSYVFVTSEKLSNALNRATALKFFHVYLLRHNDGLFENLSSELKLESVSIHCDTLTSVQGIQALPKLSRLTIRSSSFGDHHCNPLVDAPVLASLMLRDTQLMKAAVLSQLRAVTYLELVKAHLLQDEALSTFAAIPTLTRLTLAFCPKITSVTPVLTSANIQNVHLDQLPGLDALSTPGPVLKTLVLRRCPRLIVDRHTPLVGAATTLRSLTIIDVGVLDRDYLIAALPQTFLSRAIDKKVTPQHLW